MQTKHTILCWLENHEEEQKLAEYLQRHSYHCICCRSKKYFEEVLDSSIEVISLVIIDLALKETDAILACNEIKNRLNTINNPFVIIISDKAEEFTQVTALDMGADDYILKPIKLPLFLKRIEAILSRKFLKPEKSDTANSNFFIDIERHQVFINQVFYDLPKKEFDLLNLFYSAPNKIFSRKEIAIILWNEEKIAKQRTIDVHIRNIRKLLGTNLIKTLKGLGYGFNKISI